MGRIEDWGSGARVCWASQDIRGPGLKLMELPVFRVSVTRLRGWWGEVGWEPRRGLECMGEEVMKGQGGMLQSPASNPLCWTLLLADPWGPRELGATASTSKIGRAGGSPDARDAEEKQSHPLLR